MQEPKPRNELETAMEAFEQCIAVVVAAFAEQTNAARTLRNLLEGRKAMEAQFGSNPLRDRLLNRAEVMSALLAQPKAVNDEALQSVIDRVLLPPPLKRVREH